MNLTNDVFMPASVYKRNPWRLKDNLILSGAGQNSVEGMLAMSHAMGDDKKPALVAVYEHIRGTAYEKNWVVREMPVMFPGAVLQIGFSLPGGNDAELQAIVRGEGDAALREAARFYRNLQLPILLRIGYEFDGPAWNNFRPETYIRAFHHIVNVLEEEGALNVATVWDATSVGDDITPDYYPGDNVVDWFGYNSIIPNYDRVNHMAHMAKSHNKPIMSGEAAYAFKVEDICFKDWINGYFGGMRRDGVQAYQYINWEWAKSPLSKGWTSWANSRFTEDPSRKEAYLNAMSGNDMVYRGLDYAQPVCLYIDTTMGCYEGKTPEKWNKDCDLVCYTPGYDYSVEGVIPTHEEPFGANWRITGCGTLTFITPDDFFGEVAFYLPQNTDSFTLYVNDEAVYWDNSFGWLHIPINKCGDVSLCIERRDGELLHIKGIALVKKQATLEAPKPVKDKHGLKWEPLPGALHYRIFKNKQLMDITVENTYPLPENAEGSYSVEAVYLRDGASKNIIAVEEGTVMV